MMNTLSQNWPGSMRARRGKAAIAITAMFALIGLMGCSSPTGRPADWPQVKTEVHEWAAALMTEAFQALADDAGITFSLEGVVAGLPESSARIQAPWLDGIQVDQDHVFASPAAQTTYVDQPFKLNGKVIIALSSDRSVGFGLVGWSSHVDDAERDALFFSSDEERGLLPADRWAINTDEAGTLVVVEGFVSRVDQGFYMGNVDRKQVATVVFVIDVESRTVSHVEVIGTDTPGGRTTLDKTNGQWLKTEAYAYIRSLAAA